MGSFENEDVMGFWWDFHGNESSMGFSWKYSKGNKAKGDLDTFFGKSRGFY